MFFGFSTVCAGEHIPPGYGKTSSFRSSNKPYTLYHYMTEGGNPTQGTNTSNLRRRNNSNNEMSSLMFGKVQPQALALEEAVLGALMLDKDALTTVLDILRPSSFYSESHQAIYRTMINLFDKSQPIDLLTVTEGLRNSGELEKVGGPYYLVELTNRITSAANVEFHARIIAQKYIQRELIRVSTTVIKDAYEDTTDVFDLLDKAESGLFEITQQNLSGSVEPTATLALKLLKQLEELSTKPEGLTGVPTGFVNLDRLTSGWQPSDLVILAARPAMGKTAFVLSLARNAAMEFNKAVAVFSLEMSNLQLVQRLVAAEAELPSDKLRNAKMSDDEWKRLHSAIERLNKAPIFIDDTPGLNIFELRAKCRRLKKQHDLQLVIIDYLQLMTGGVENNRSGNREQEISNISRNLKGLAKELNIPVIALSQLSRAVETRGGSKRPQLSDLRECVTGDTLVYLTNGETVPIETLVGQTPEVWSMDPVTLDLIPAQSDLIWEVGEKPVFEIVLEGGQRIKTTANHRLYTREGWKHTSELRIGDKLATPKPGYFSEHLVPFSLPAQRNSMDTRLKPDTVLVEETENYQGSVIAWSAIQSIALAGVEMVYDLTVPGTHSWIANGIISHNSGAIEQDADIVSFIYRPEYYGLTEDEEGMPVKGIAEIIVAKHRNGATDTVRLKYVSEYVKFVEPDDPNFSSLLGPDPLQGPNTAGPSIVTIPSRFNDEDIPF